MTAVDAKLDSYGKCPVSALLILFRLRMCAGRLSGTFSVLRGLSQAKRCPPSPFR